MSGAIVTAAWAPVRSEPTHRAELTSQWLCGETLKVLRRSGDWLECQGPDAYVGWSPVGSLRLVGAEEAERWREQATAWSLGSRLETGIGAGDAVDPSHIPDLARTPNHLPWGARVRLLTEGRVGLPDGTVARVHSAETVLNDTELGARFLLEGSSLVRAAQAWRGAPYLWGGRTQAGVDCSGFVQALFRVHGVRLPRDSGNQADQFASLALMDGDPGALDPGDLLFFAPEGTGITHVALATGGSGIIHAAASVGCVATGDLAGGTDLERLLRGSIVHWTRPLEAVRQSRSSEQPELSS
jgi:cell wall-associated NlpC family hydrolase